MERQLTLAVELLTARHCPEFHARLHPPLSPTDHLVNSSVSLSDYDDRSIFLSLV